MDPQDNPKPCLCFPSLENNHWEHSEHMRMDFQSLPSVLPRVISLLIRFFPFQTHLLSHHLLVSWLLTRGSLSALYQCWVVSLEASGMEAETGLCTESYLSQVLQIFCETQFYPPPEQPLWLLWLLYRWDLEKATCSLFLASQVFVNTRGSGRGQQDHHPKWETKKTIIQSGTGDPAHSEHHRMLFTFLSNWLRHGRLQYTKS